MTDETAPIAVGAGVAILLLAGGGYALMRRRGDEDDVYTVEEVSPQPMVADEPTMAKAMAVGAMAPPTVAPATVAATAEQAPHAVATPEGFDTLDNVPTAQVPEDFDVSRYGRHVQAAYRGPTPDNPSLSLKRRLARARFYDQRERMAAQGTATAPTDSQPAAQPTAPARSGEFVTTRVNRPQQRPGFRPAWSS
jgi:hypothetical protein